MRMRSVALPVAALIALTGCATVPAGPTVMVLPGQGRGFEQFQGDDYTCRNWAAQQAGVSPGDSATRNTITGAAVGTLLGAAAGAAIGAAAGNPGAGAAVGAGVGVVGGTATGASAGYSSYGAAQRAYDGAYMQCMYSKGHQIPVARGSLPASYTSQPAAAPPPPPPPPPAVRSNNVPPPPAGTPPPPPPGATR